MPRVYFGFDAKSVRGEHVFVSYSRGDADRVKGIALALHQMGLPIWYDDGLIPGNQWEDEIMDNVEQSRITIFFLTKALFQRDKSYMQDEFQYAVDFRKPALCIWLDDLGNMDCSKLSREMHKWWNKIRKLHSIEVFHLTSDAERANEIFRGLCHTDGKFTQYASKSEPKPISNPTPPPARQTQTEKLTPPPAPAPKRQVKVGDVIPFGQYPQGAGGEVKPLEWRVLDVRDGKALLITDKLIDYRPYNEKYISVTWADCTLRKWLHHEFMQRAFSRAEQEQILSVVNQNPNNPQYGTNGGKPTQDRVFLLSIEEAKHCFSSDKDRTAYTTDYAHKQGHDSKDRSDWWWLRSPGRNCDDAAGVHSYGCIDQRGDRVTGYVIAVRPALWLNL